jgi:hypothetical protein
MVSPKTTMSITIRPIIEPIIDNVNAKESMLYTKINQTDNKARQTHPQHNERPANADMINPNPSTTYTNLNETLHKAFNKALLAYAFY